MYWTIVAFARTAPMTDRSWRHLRVTTGVQRVDEIGGCGDSRRCSATVGDNLTNAIAIAVIADVNDLRSALPLDQPILVIVLVWRCLCRSDIARQCVSVVIVRVTHNLIVLAELFV